MDLPGFNSVRCDHVIYIGLILLCDCDSCSKQASREGSTSSVFNETVSENRGIKL